MQQLDGELADRPTGIRYQIVGWATVMSLLLYLDRFCISICTNYIRQDLDVSAFLVSWLSFAFFLTYGLFQVPSGWLTDKFGVRPMLTLFILAWSLCTGLQAFAQNFALLASLQLLCGMAQAGAYPAGARLVRDWNPPASRGIGSAMVALGGRIGGAMAPILTATMLVLFVPTTTDSRLTDQTFLSELSLAKKWIPKTKSISKPRQAERQLAYLWDVLTPEEQSLIRHLGDIANANDASANIDPQTVPQTVSPEQSRQLRELLNRLIDVPTLYRPDLFDLIIEREGQRLSQRSQQLASQQRALSTDQLRRLNRLALESTFGKDLGNIYVSGWRPSMLVYGVIGIAIAGLFWWQVRDTPLTDERCNAGERELIAMGTPPASTSVTTAGSFPLTAMLTNLSLWGNCLLQCTTNIGWVFLVRTMPQYLEEVHNVPLVLRGWMTSVPIWAGVIGVFFGGRLTDWLGQKLGLKWGRRLPVLITRFTAAVGYGICIVLSYLFPAEQSPPWMPWVYVAALSLVSVSVDIGVPSVWAYMQDVGGKYTASVLGWGNMWGNLAAAAATPFYAAMLGKAASLSDWNMLFASLAGVFVLGAFGALLMDSSKPLVPERIP